MPEDFQDFPALNRVRLDALVNCERSRCLEQLDAYHKNRQYESRRYDWDGRYRGYGNDADIAPGWYVPIKHRRPSTRFNLPKLIVGRLTTMMLGEDSWPEVNVEGDPDAEDYVKALVTESELPAKFNELRDKGGRSGTAVVSFAFIEGRPRIKVHNARHIHTVRWADRDEHRPAEVLKAYSYTRPGYTSEGRPIEKTYYFARYWTETEEVVWDPIPEDLARAGTWAQLVPSQRVVHGYGECPVYICQNIPETDEIDGLSDFDGLLDECDSINTLLSASTRGTVANVDPTVVIKDDPAKNPGHIKKGSGQAIYSKGGAEYLELKGESLKAALELVKTLTRYSLDVAGVIVGDPEKLGPRAQSAAALRLLHLPMINQCDILRAQYGKLLVQLLTGMLRAAKKIEGSAAGPIVVTADGRRVQHKPTVVLPPRIEHEPANEGAEKGAERRERNVRQVERTPGQSERVTLKWPAYFQPTMQDIKDGTEASGKARGVTISDRTAVRFTAPFYGVEDIDQELIEIEADREARMLSMNELEHELGVGGDPSEGGGKPDKGKQPPGEE